MLKLPSLRDVSTEIYSLQEITSKTICLFFLSQSSRLISLDFFIKIASICTFRTRTLRFIYLSPEGMPGVGFEHLHWSTVGNIFTP